MVPKFTQFSKVYLNRKNKGLGYTDKGNHDGFIK